MQQNGRDLMKAMSLSDSSSLMWVCLLSLLSLVSHGQPFVSEKLIQAQLDSGNDVALQPSQIVILTDSLKFRVAGQRIETVGAESAADFATIMHAGGAQGTLIEAKGIAGATLANLILDGNRPGFRQPEGTLTAEPMLSFGGEGANQQEVSRCIVIGGRSAGGWGAIHLHEGGDGNLVQDNIVFSIGTDIRGNGRSVYEKPFGWGDGISTASRNTVIVNNAIYDTTDEGIMVQGAPGTLVKGNVVVAIAREMLGGIALIDPFDYYLLDAEQRTYDYRGVTVEDNLILAAGSRIHVGLAMGGAPWNPHFDGTTLVGASVRDNHISGSAAGYGYVVKGVDAFVIEGNTSDAIYSGLGDGLPNLPPDAPLPFMYDPAAVGSSRLQPSFQPQQKSLVKVVRSSRSPKDSRDPLGYRDAPYPAQEAKAVIEMAYLEMLGRAPQAAEQAHWLGWLQESLSNADTLRRNLMTTPEFVQQQGYVDPLDLHEWRNERWLSLILTKLSDIQAAPTDWPDAHVFNQQLLNALQN
jgi:hypothetical protein